MSFGIGALWDQRPPGKPGRIGVRRGGLTAARGGPTFSVVLIVVEPGAAIASLDHEPVGVVMYQPPKLERFGTLRQLTAAPFAALGVSLSLSSGSLPIGAGDCGPNVPVGDPSACGRS